MNNFMKINEEVRADKERKFQEELNAQKEEERRIANANQLGEQILERFRKSIPIIKEAFEHEGLRVQTEKNDKMIQLVVDTGFPSPIDAHPYKQAILFCKIYTNEEIVDIDTDKGKQNEPFLKMSDVIAESDDHFSYRLENLYRTMLQHLL